MNLRPVLPADLDALVRLYEELGYPLTRERLRPRLERVLASPHDQLLGAELAGQLVGAMHLQQRLHLTKDAAAEVCSLVVLERHRGEGIGRALMAAAEAWATERRATQVFLTSNVTRLEAHAFYRNLGYLSSKTSHVFTKTLPPSTP